MRRPALQAVIRLGVPDDAAAIAALHAESWRSAYRGLIPDDDLGNGLDDERRKFWEDRFASPHPDRRIAFAAMAVPSTLPPPGRLSMISCCPMASDSTRANSRAAMSAPPPGEMGAIMRMDFDG